MRRRVIYSAARRGRRRRDRDCGKENLASLSSRRLSFQQLEARQLLSVSTVPSATLSGLTGSDALVFDKAGDLFVANYNHGTGTAVSEFAPGSTTAAATLTGVAGPSALAFDKAGDLFVANYGNGSGTSVSEFAPGGTTPIETLTGVGKPMALAFDSHGNLFVANDQNGQSVSEFAPGNLTPTATLQGAGSFPAALAVDSADDVYVGAQSDGITEFLAGSTTPAATLSTSAFSQAMLFDSNGNLYVANSLADTVSEFAPGNTTASTTFTGLNQPTALAFDGGGNLYVANSTSTGTVSVFAAGNTTPTATLTGLHQPDALAFDSSGNLYVSNKSNNTISVFDVVIPAPPVMTASSGTLSYGADSGAQAIDPAITVSDTESATIESATVAIASGYVSGEDVLGFTAQNGISGSFDAASGSLTLTGTASIADYQTALASVTYTDTAHDASTADRTIDFAVDDGLLPSNTATKIISPEPKLSVTSTPSMTLAGLNNPEQIAINSNGYVFVANYSGTTVSEFAPGSSVAIASLIGLNHPSGMLFNSNDDLFVSNEITNGTVSEFFPGTTTANRTLTGLISPLGLVLDSSGDLFVANYGGTTVSEFTPGSTVATKTLTGLDAPLWLAFDSNGDLFVSNQAADTVSEFAPGSTTATATLTGLSSPAELVFDASGNLFVANRGSNTVSEFGTGKTTPTMTLTGLDSPRRMLFDASGNLFVTNNANNTVSVYAPGSDTPMGTLTGMDGPRQMVFDPSGNLYVTNQFNNTLSVFDSTAALPAVMPSSGTLSYSPNSGAQAIDPSIALTDGASSTIESATVSIGSGYVNGEDQLGFANQGTITGSFDAARGKLILSGSASVSDYQAALASVTYSDTQHDASADSRTIVYIVNDGQNPSDPVTKALDPQTDAVTQLVITGEPPAGVTAGSEFALTVAAEDDQGFVVPGYSGSLSVSLANNPGSATLGGTTTVSATAGMAVFSDLSLDKADAGYTLLLSGFSLSSATTSAISVMPGAATQLVVVSQPPASVTAGNPFSLTVEAEDSFGNVDTTYGGSVTAALSNNPGSATLGGTKTVNATAGVAVFSSLSLDEADAGYTLLLSGVSLSSATTSVISVSPGTATQLVAVSQPPTSVVAGNSFSLTVEAEDSFGNVDTSYAGSISAALSNNPGSAMLGGTKTVNATAGVAVFSSLSLDKADPGYTLLLSGVSLSSVTTSAISVSPGTATQLAVVSQPPAIIVAGSLFGVTVEAEDAFGNVDTSYAGSIAAALLNNPGSATLGGTHTVSATAGVAVFSDLTLDKADPGYTLSLRGTSLSSATTSAVSVSPGAATQLVILNQPPASVTIGISFGFSVAAEDAEGNLATGFSGAITAALASNPGSANLGGTTIATAAGGAASFSNVSIDNSGEGYTLELSADGLSPAVTTAIDVAPTIVITGTSGSDDHVSITFTSPTQFVVSDGVSSTAYSTSGANQIIYNAPDDGTASSFVFDDPDGTFSATQSLGSTTIAGAGFSFQASGVTNLYIYGNSGSTATINVADGGSESHNFFVDSIDGNYSYIADPSTHEYSELSGFGNLTVTGSAGTTYAYLYSTSGASSVLSPTESTLTTNGGTVSLTGFPQVYFVGAAAGGDQVTIHSAGGEFVGTPQFSYATDAAGSFLLGAIYSADVSAQASNAGTDSAVFYSYDANAFDGAAGDSSLSGATTNAEGAPVNFTIEALDYSTVSVLESGLGTDTASLAAAGGSTLVSTPTASTLTMGTSAITVDTFFEKGQQQFLPVANKIAVVGMSGSTATLDDSAGANALVVGGSTASLTAGLRAVTLEGFDHVEADQQSGSSDTLHQNAAIDFSLSTVGNWTSI